MKNLETLEMKVENTENSENNLKPYLNKLIKIATLLRLLSYYIVGSSIFGLLFSLSLYSSIIIFSRKLSDDSFLINVLLVWFNFISVACLINYEFLCKKGNILFSEISDELEWNLKNEKSGNESPNIDTRIILRSYIQASELPFFRGKYGTGIYLLINIVSLIILIFSLAQHRF